RLLSANQGKAQQCRLHPVIKIALTFELADKPNVLFVVIKNDCAVNFEQEIRLRFETEHAHQARPEIERNLGLRRMFCFFEQRPDTLAIAADYRTTGASDNRIAIILVVFAIEPKTMRMRGEKQHERIGWVNPTGQRVCKKWHRENLNLATTPIWRLSPNRLGLQGAQKRCEAVR
ncbi:MAG: hypothetical protein RIS80_790, partial [Actinomycetota bacterium]